MAAPTKTATHTFISHAALAHPGVSEGTPDDVSTYFGGTIVVRIANVETTANADGVKVWIQGSVEASGDHNWYNLPGLTFEGSTTVAETEALTATEAVGVQTLAMASTTNMVVGDLIYVQDGSVVTDGEWHRIIGVVTNTSIDIDAGLAVEKTSSDFVWTESDEYVVQLPDISGLKRINVLIVHRAATGSNLEVEATGVFMATIE